MANVQYVRDEITEMLPRWTLIRDCLSGQAAIKAHDKKTASEETVDRYLPKPNATDRTDANRIRYLQYIERAVFYNVTSRTHAGMVGQVFQKDPVLKVPTLLERLVADSDGSGVPLLQQAKKALGFTLGYGRAGLLTDFPKTQGPASQQQVLEGKVRASLSLYAPWEVINWRTRTVGARQMLSLVVIEEPYELSDDGFEASMGGQWRVLSIEQSGIYRAAVWRAPDGGGEPVEVEYSNPTDSAGNNLTEIPFQFIGAINNDPLVDLPPLYDLATLNVSHYRNSADYEEACFVVGQPTPWASGLTQAWVDKNFAGGKVQIGSRAFLPLPVGGSCGLLQASPNTMPKEAMEIKERQMVALGAKLIEQQSVQRTLGEARLEYATEISVLGSCAKNVASAYVNALRWAGMFTGVSEASEFELTPDFELGRMDAQERAQLMAEWQGKAITFTEMRDALKKAGIATQDDEDAKSEIEQSLDFGPGVNGSRPGETLPMNDDQPETR